jgi:hypothetical protein
MSEFDDYANKGYHDLIDDPIKTNLCGNSNYFLQQKISLLHEFVFKEKKM